MRRDQTLRAGFTLIEIMAVVAIIGLLMAIVGPRVVGALAKARVTTTSGQLSQLESALTGYQMDNGRFPTTEQGLRALIEKPTGAPEPYDWRPGGYLGKKEIPRDAWNGEFQYLSPGEHNADSFDLWSLGADGKPGGSDNDADIGNWAAEHETP
ncbi:MAG TPA: type II secretion system major pseudopilin GspG [Myxococcota bacterium]|jgi:general secretion pathway protein G